jgi:formylglycine-generating enzyme required for sulfatase activity
MVNWYEAVAFCRWLSEIIGEEIRLPTEAEWELAARGRKGLEFPWGNGFRSGYGNIYETVDNSGEYNLNRTSAVGTYPQGKSPEGILDMAGIVWEWCLNKQEKPRIITVDYSNDWRVLRGGSWSIQLQLARCTFREADLPHSRHVDCGFRIVQLALHDH